MDNNNKIITEELKQIVVLMNYDRSKTLMEQDAKFDMYQRQRNAEHLGISYEEARRMEHPAFYEMLDNIDAHDILMAIEIGAMIIAPFTGPLAPAFLAVSYGAGLADAAVYKWVDDDPHSAWIALGLTVVPGFKFGKVFKKSGWFVKKFGRKTTSELLEKYNKFKKGDKSLKFTEEELKFLKEAGEDIASETTQKIIKEEQQKLVGLLDKTDIVISLGSGATETVFKSKSKNEAASKKKEIPPMNNPSKAAYAGAK